MPVVPLITRGPTEFNLWTLAAVTARGVFQGNVTGEVVDQVAPGVIDSGALWAAPYGRAQHEACPYECMVTGCTNKARQWMGLAAALHYQGCLWQPTHGAPIRVGLCPMHHHGLISDLCADVARSQRLEHRNHQGIIVR